MTYIWNRADRVKDIKNITLSFNSWLKKQKQLSRFLTNQKERDKLHIKIEKQTRNYQEALNKLNNNITTQITKNGINDNLNNNLLK
jgi:C4-dicarboxylate-specific signal transduction histidine kinase